jgi:hypothetical protein
MYSSKCCKNRKGGNLRAKPEHKPSLKPSLIVMSTKLHLEPSRRKDKRYDAVFIDKSGKITRVPFGLLGGSTYLEHKDPVKRVNYIARHRVNEDWSDPYKPGTLSRYILWEYTSLSQGLKNYKTRFGFS